MGELNERYADVVEQLDGWIKSYIKEICSGFEPNVMKLYVENTFEDLSAESGFEKYNMGYISSEMKWGFFVNKSEKKESLINESTGKSRTCSSNQGTRLWNSGRCSSRKWV